MLLVLYLGSAVWIAASICMVINTLAHFGCPTPVVDASWVRGAEVPVCNFNCCESLTVPSNDLDTSTCYYTCTRCVYAELKNA